MSGLLQDLRHSVRTLQKSPGFVALVVLSLALGIGACSSIFSVIDTLLYRPLPYEHPEQLIAIWELRLNQPDSFQQPPIAELLDWKKQNHVFADIALTSGNEEGVLVRDGQAEHIQMQDVTPNFFSLLGGRPMLGRVFFASEMQDHEQAVVISESFWNAHFNRDPHVLGKTFRLVGLPSTVVGVMPESFKPLYGERVDIWQPVDPASKRFSERADHWLNAIARLKSSTSLAQAQVEMDAISRVLEQVYPATNKGIGVKLIPLHQDIFGGAGQFLYPLFGAVAFVLLIACANVANLMQSRTELRRAEFAVRMSLGASRTRLVRQSLLESILLGGCGGFLGLFLTYGGIRIFLALAGPGFPNAEKVTVDQRIVLFTAIVSFVTSLLFGLGPAFQASRSDLSSAFRSSASGVAVSSRGIMRGLLASAEIALAMVLLIGTGLMINTMIRLRRVDPGFDAKNLLTMTIQLPEGGKYMERVPGGDMERATTAVNDFHERLLKRVAGLPGVESVGAITGIPTHYSAGPTFTIVGQPLPEPDRRPQTNYGQISAKFFQTLKIPLKKGRYIEDQDVEGMPWVVVVNEAFVRRFFPNEDPIGKQIRLRFDPYPTEEDHTRQIVGVVGDITQHGLGLPAPPYVYASFLQQPSVYPGGMIVTHLWQDLAVRPRKGIPADRLAQSIREIVKDLDPDQAVTNVMSMEDVLASSNGEPRFYLQLLGIFAAVAVFMAAMGVYGVMSYFVSHRAHDIGVRMALGAHPADIATWITKLGLRLVLFGIVAGAGLAVALTRLISGFLFGVTPTDPPTYVAVAGSLAMLALLACYIPARRAMKVDPMVALRYE